METHIVTIPDNKVREVNQHVISWHDLHAAKFTFDKPFRLHMDDGEVVLAHKVVRIMPKRRMVVFATWSGRPVVMKLFYDPQHARRHMEKDMTGIQLLSINKIPTPKIYHSGVSEDRRIYVLIYERIFDAVSLNDIWRKRADMQSVLPVLQSALIELAIQHVLGVRQCDLHLKNFLLLGEIIYTLDGGQVQSHPGILPKEESMESVALFLAQLGVSVDQHQEHLFRHYAKSRGWILKSDDFSHLFLLICEANAKRWLQFQRKIFRESTEFKTVKNKDTYGMLDRSYEGIEFLSFLKNPDTVFHHPSAVVLKDGRSSTVVKITLDNRDLVVKRYNMKNIWHRLRRCLRSTRAAKSWQLAHKLKLFGVATAKPVAYLEQRVLGLRGQSYFVSEYVSGEHGGEYFNRQRSDEAKTTTMVNKIAVLLHDLQKLQITHGDLKITNILINAKSQPVLIDLDGAAEHNSMAALRRAWRKEVIRFLENFKSMPTLQDKFKTVF